MAPNPGGANQMGNVTLQPAYGDVAKQTQLTRESPMSGSPFAAHALETARRSGKQATRGKRGGAEPQEQAMPAPESLMPSDQFNMAQVWQQLASVPGASTTIQKLALSAANQAQTR